MSKPGKVVVIGGAGFLGGHVVRELERQGHAVTVFDLCRPAQPLPGVQYVVGDLLDEATVQAVVAGSQAVFHYAGIADIDEASQRPVDTVRSNILGTVQLLEICRQEKVERFVYASTVYVFSGSGSFYRCSKQACEQYIIEYGRSFGLPYTILRYGSLYGEGANDRNSVHRYLSQALLNGRIEYYGEPDFLREYIHVEDAARLSVEILGEEFRDETVILTGQHPLTVATLFKTIEEILGRPIQVDYREPPAHHYRITPYSYNPRFGKKLVSHTYVDMGQGLLKCLETIHRESGRAQPEVLARQPQG
jgi:UDP-glucose 4-epimerase